MAEPHRWFSEHDFTGETVYADPIMFATAVAMQTRRVKLGFAVLEMRPTHEKSRSG